MVQWNQLTVLCLGLWVKGSKPARYLQIMLLYTMILWGPQWEAILSKKSSSIFFYLGRSRQVYRLSKKSGRGTISNGKSWYIAQLMSWAIPQLWRAGYGKYEELDEFFQLFQISLPESYQSLPDPASLSTWSGNIVISPSWDYFIDYLIR